MMAAALIGCQGRKASVPGDADDVRPYGGVAAAEILKFTGTEPFWSGEISGTTLRWTTPENQTGTVLTVKRFAGRNGLSFSGTLEGKSFDMTVTPDPACSDGMSDRTYPFNVTVRIGEDMRNGCAWSAQHPFTGPKQP